MVTLSTFRIGADLFGVEAGRVQEATRDWDANPVPLAPPEVLGLMNLRGEVITLIDLRRRLGYPERAGDSRPVNLVVRVHGGESVGLLVDELADFAEVDSATAEDVPPHALPLVRESVDCAFQVHRGDEADGGVLLHLNVERAVDVSSSIRRTATHQPDTRQAASEASAKRPSVSVASGRQG